MNQQLSEILKNIDFEIRGILPKTINKIQADSRLIGKDNLFVAIRGLATDGHKYLHQCEKSGIAAVVVEEFSDDISIPQIKVKNSKKALLEIANNYYEKPTDSLKIIGITGTNGKTTTTYLIDKILRKIGYKCGTIGTFGYSINDIQHETDLTTPDIIQLFDIFYQMKNNGIEYVVMEVSSHAIAMNRVEKIKFDAAVFTNISRDHLDFHKTIENYAETKSKLFSMIPKSGFTIINNEDKYAPLFLKKSQSHNNTFSINSNTDFSFSENTTFNNGIHGEIIIRDKKYDFQSLLSGEFNMKNLLAAIGVCHNLNIPMIYILNVIREIAPPPGRLQEISFSGTPRVFVDYAHTPDAITNALSALKSIVPKDGKLISVFGCGGNRDKTKRSLMAKASEEIANFTILTTDNPRFENSEDIINDTKKGFRNKEKYTIISNRKDAIIYAIATSTTKDIVAVLGKGHETYQEINGTKYHFDDAEIVREFLNEIK